MKIVVDNKDALVRDDITDKTVRIKALIVNDKKEILLGYSFNTYQFPGGHLEAGESLNEGLNRELKEELGVDIDTKDLEPFFLYEHIDKDYPEINNNRLSQIYYYLIEANIEINLDNTNYTLEEKIGNYEIRYIPLDYIEHLLKSNGKIDSKNEVITNEMLAVIKEYKKYL